MTVRPPAFQADSTTPAPTTERRCSFVRERQTSFPAEETRRQRFDQNSCSNPTGHAQTKTVPSNALEPASQCHRLKPRTVRLNLPKDQRFHSLNLRNRKLELQPTLDALRMSRHWQCENSLDISQAGLKNTSLTTKPATPAKQSSR